MLRALRVSSASGLVVAALAAPALAQTSFDHDRFSAATTVPAGILTEGFPGSPSLAIPALAMGLMTTDDINALSYGDEANAMWVAPCFPGAGTCDDLDAFEYSPPFGAPGVYFSLKAGSPTLAAISATPGDILYSDFTSPPIIASLGGGGGLATAANLGTPGADLDALNVVGSVGPLATGGGVIVPGPVGPSIGVPGPPVSTHLVEWSVLIGGIDADVFVRTGPGVAAVHTPALALGVLAHENLNALEAVSPCAPGSLLATRAFYNATITPNADTLTATRALIGTPWSATVTRVPPSIPGNMTVRVRRNKSLPNGTNFVIPSAGRVLISGPILATLTGTHNGITGTISTAIPLSCAFIGLHWSAQAQSGGGGIRLSSAVEGTVGDF